MKKTRLHELSPLHWLVFCITLTLTSYLIARQPEDNPVPYFMMALLIGGFVKVVDRLT